MASTEAEDFEDAAASDCEANVATLKRWKDATTLFADVVAKRVQKVADEGDESSPDGDKRIKQIASLVLSAQRAMEMKDSYEQKVRSRQKSDPTSGERRMLQRLEQVARAAGIPIPGARSRDVRKVGE